MHRVPEDGDVVVADLLGDALHGRVEEVGSDDVAGLVSQLHTHSVAHTPFLQTRQLETLLDLQQFKLTIKHENTTM